MVATLNKVKLMEEMYVRRNKEKKGLLLLLSEKRERCQRPCSGKDTKNKSFGPEICIEINKELITGRVKVVNKVKVYKHSLIG